MDTQLAEWVEVLGCVAKFGPEDQHHATFLDMDRYQWIACKAAATDTNVLFAMEVCI